jgi:hypothetical protein
MELNMIFDKGGDEIVRVVVSCLHSNVNWVALLSTSDFEVFWHQLIRQEVV